MPAPGTSRRKASPLRQLVAHMVATCRELVQSPNRLIEDDEAAQAVVNLIPLLATSPAAGDLQKMAPWLLAKATPWQAAVLRQGLKVLETGEPAPLAALIPLARTALAEIAEKADENPSEWLAIHLFEQFLKAYAQTERRAIGAFFTPRPIVNYLVRQVLAECVIQDSLPTAHFQDPATGTGTFLCELVRQIHQHWHQSPLTNSPNDSPSWSSFVSQSLLSRLQGTELLPVPCLLAQWNLASTLTQTGFDFSHPGRIEIRQGNALVEGTIVPLAKGIGPHIILGNPPFSSLSENRGAWITRLVHGSPQQPGYLQIGERKLGERKTWLHDDYVKFFRLAQYLVERAGSGMIAFVTNHGYLDNVTFRFFRKELARVFPSIQLVDLHGNRKKGEQTPSGNADVPVGSPSGSRDENVFGLDQGVALGLFTQADTPSITRADLWGSRADKLALLASATPLPFFPIHPAAAGDSWTITTPLSATDRSLYEEYAAAISLAELMPVATSAPVTARDRLVIAHSREELIARLTDFCNLQIPDEEIRRRWFGPARSAKYLPGDTRGWKLPEARRKLAAQTDWASDIRPCWYRPLDRRYILWNPAMLDWPRQKVMSHLLAAGNLALVARRQMLPGQPCNYFWITDGLALDGLIRSDNRGSESLFPLFLDQPVTSGAERCVNLQPAWLARLAEQIGNMPAAKSVLFYIYALFQAAEYRARYADFLRQDFPRVLLPTSRTLFDQMSQIGEELSQAHLLKTGPDKPIHPPTPQFSDESIAAYRVGGYTVLPKWEAAHQHLPAAEFQSQNLAVRQAIAHSLALVAQLSAIIAQHGTWSTCFCR